MSFLTIVALVCAVFWAGLRIVDALWSKPKFRDVGFGQVMRVPRKNRNKRSRLADPVVRDAAVSVVVALRRERSRFAVVDVATIAEPSTEVVEARAVEAGPSALATGRTQDDGHATDPEPVAQRIIPSAVIAVLLVAGFLGFLALVIWANTAG